MASYIKEQYPHLKKKFRVISSGVFARNGAGASQVVRHVARLNGFNLSAHKSQRISASLVRKADAILVMEQYQKEEVLKQFPKAEDKTFRMMEYLWKGDADEIADIPDPTGQDTVDYEEFIEVAHSEVDRIFHEMMRDDLL